MAPGNKRRPHFDMRVISIDDEFEDVDIKRTKKSPQLIAYRHPPFFMVFVSILELCTFLYYSMRADEPLSMVGPVPFRSKLIFNPYRRHEPWRYLTYMLIHAGYWHISFNLLIQLAVGVPLESVHHFNPVFIIYTGGVVGGALGNSILDPHSYLAGASSGCYALIAAHLANLIINWRELRHPCWRLLTLLLFSAADVATAVYERHYKSGSLAYRVSYGGHLAGALSGLLLGLVYLRNARVHSWERVVSRLAFTIYLGAMKLLAIAYSCIYTDHFPPADTRDSPWLLNPYSRDRE